ncbi:hypothetical protein OXX69_002818 [Metschnikowia pulcherrima]
MSRTFQQVSDIPYQNPVSYYYPGNYQQVPPRMPVVDFHYNSDLSYPQGPGVPANWPLYPRQSPSQKDEMVSPLSNNMKFQYPTQPQMPTQMPMQQNSLQYSAVPYMVQNSTSGMQVPRSTENASSTNSQIEPLTDSQSDPQMIPPRSGTALMPNLPTSTKVALLDPASSHASSGNSTPEKPSRTGSSTKLHKLGKSHSSGHTDGSNNCKVCGKVFQKPYNLKSHMKTHSTERPYKCQFCPKTFARSHDRKRHENLHGGQKNFKCEGYLRNGITKWGCGKQFARSDALARHFRTETGYLCIKQFMEEEKEKEAGDEGRAELVYPHQQSHSSQQLFPQHYPLMPQQMSQQMPQQIPQQQHYPSNSSARAYDPLSYMPPPQISLPPLLRH